MKTHVDVYSELRIKLRYFINRAFYSTVATKSDSYLNIRKLRPYLPVLLSIILYMPFEAFNTIYSISYILYYIIVS